MQTKAVERLTCIDYSFINYKKIQIMESKDKKNAVAPVGISAQGKESVKNLQNVSSKKPFELSRLKKLADIDTAIGKIENKLITKAE